MLIHNVAERKEAANRKMLALLTFLKEETYSDFKTLKKVVGLNVAPLWGEHGSAAASTVFEILPHLNAGAV